MLDAMMTQGVVTTIAGLIRYILLLLLGNELLVDIIMKFVGIGAMIGVILTAAIVFTYAERKVCALIQVRLGPNRVGGRFGVLQPVADMLKLMSKEDIIPAGSDRIVWSLAPMLLFVPSALVYAFFPFEEGIIFSDVNVGVFLLLAISSQAVLPFLMGGYASNSKYAYIGGIRTVAQMLSYEAPMVFSLLGIVMISGSMKMSDIVAMQGEHVWFVLLQPIAFIIFLITATAETNRTPFDLVEDESEIVAGPFTEYSGMRWALFFLAEYANLLSVSILATTFFLGGWQGPFLPGIVWFWFKVLVMVFVFMWFRWTFPRTRIDQMLTFGWKVLLPLAIVNMMFTGIGVYIYRWL